MKKQLYLIIFTIFATIINLLAMEYHKPIINIDPKQPRNEVIQEISNNPHITELKVIGRMVTPILNILLKKEQPSLKKLNLTLCKFTEKDIKKILIHYSSLESLNVSWCINSAKEIIEALQEGKGNQLKELNLEETNATDTDAETILLQCPFLTEFNLAWCSFSTDGVIAALQQNCGKQLKKLNLENTNTMPNQVYTILSKCDSLEELDLCWCFKSTEGLSHALQMNFGCQLKKLNLEQTAIKPEEIYIILKNCQNLIEINLTDCPNVGAEIARAITNGYGHQLQKLNLQNTAIKPEEIYTILKNCRNLTGINLAHCPDARVGIEQAVTDGYGHQLQKLELNSTDETIEFNKKMAMILASFKKD